MSSSSTYAARVEDYPQGPLLTPSPLHWSEEYQEWVYWVGDTLEMVWAMVHLISTSEGDPHFQVFDCRVIELTDGLGGGPIDGDGPWAIMWAARAWGEQTSGASGAALHLMHEFTEEDVGLHTATCTFTYNYQPDKDGQRTYRVVQPEGNGPGGEGVPVEVLEDALLPTE